MAQDKFEAPPLPANLDQLGKNLQRTMTLLATSTPEHRNRVRILFYGQSVTAGPWSYAVMEDLKKAYPASKPPMARFSMTRSALG